MTLQTQLLQADITTLPLSSDLKALLSSKGYTNLQLFLQQKISHLRFTDGLTFHQELEIFDIVEKNGFVRLWND